MIKRLFAPAQSLAVLGGALLLLRGWLGAAMLLNHGLGKLQKFGTLKDAFPDPLGVGSLTSLSLAVFAEFFCAILLVLGLFTRFAALCLTVTMIVAFTMIHRGALSGENSGELAFIYMAGFVALLIAGPGRFSLDQKISGKKG
jgi:putative oxidoreductase